MVIFLRLFLVESHEISRNVAPKVSNGIPIIRVDSMSKKIAPLIRKTIPMILKVRASSCDDLVGLFSFIALLQTKK